MKSFEKAFDPSILAAFVEGPKTGMPTVKGINTPAEASSQMYDLSGKQLQYRLPEAAQGLVRLTSPKI